MSLAGRVMGFLAAAVALAASAEAADLSVVVKPVRSDQGHISVAVYDNSKNFLMVGRQIASADVSPVVDSTTIVFMGLTPGNYAVAAFYDENGSGEFDTNFLGVPVEGYGFSNGAEAFLGPPSFAALVVLERSAWTEIRLSY